MWTAPRGGAPSSWQWRPERGDCRLSGARRAITEDAQRYRRGGRPSAGHMRGEAGAGQHHEATREAGGAAGQPTGVAAAEGGLQSPCGGARRSAADCGAIAEDAQAVVTQTDGVVVSGDIAVVEAEDAELDHIEARGKASVEQQTEGATGSDLRRRNSISESTASRASATRCPGPPSKLPSGASAHQRASFNQLSPSVFSASCAARSGCPSLFGTMLAVMVGRRRRPTRRRGRW